MPSSSSSDESAAKRYALNIQRDSPLPNILTSIQRIFINTAKEKTSLNLPPSFMCLSDAGSDSLYAKMLMSSNHDAGRGSVIIPIVTTMGANPQRRAVRVFWKMKSMSNRRSPMAGSDARLRTPEAFLLLGTGIIFYYYFG